MKPPWAVLLLAGVVAPSIAKDARVVDFDRLPDPLECSVLVVRTAEVAHGRDRGVSKADAIRSAEDKKLELPPQVFDDVYDFSQLSWLDLATYWGWECRARVNGLRIARLAKVAGPLAACPKNVQTREEGKLQGVCLRRVRNLALGLPTDFTPPAQGSTAIQDVTPR